MVPMVGKTDNGNFVDTIKNKTLFDRRFPKIVFSDYIFFQSVLLQGKITRVSSQADVIITFPSLSVQKTKLNFNIQCSINCDL